MLEITGGLLWIFRQVLREVTVVVLSRAEEYRKRGSWVKVHTGLGSLKKFAGEATSSCFTGTCKPKIPPVRTSTHTWISRKLQCPVHIKLGWVVVVVVVPAAGMKEVELSSILATLSKLLPILLFLILVFQLEVAVKTSRFQLNPTICSTRLEQSNLVSLLWHFIHFFYFNNDY